MESLTFSAEGNRMSRQENKQNFNIFEETSQGQENSKIIDVNKQSNQGILSVANVGRELNQHRKSQQRLGNYKSSTPYEAEYQNINNPQNLSFSKERSQRKERLENFYSHKNLAQKNQYLSSNENKLEKITNSSYRDLNVNRLARPVNTTESLNLNIPNAKEHKDLLFKNPLKAEPLAINGNSATPNRGQIHVIGRTGGVSMPSIRSRSLQRNQIAPSRANLQPGDLENTRNNKLEYYDGVHKSTDFSAANSKGLSKAGKLHKDLKQLSRRLKEIKATNLEK